MDVFELQNLRLHKISYTTVDVNGLNGSCGDKLHFQNSLNFSLVYHAAWLHILFKPRFHEKTGIDYVV